MKIETQIPKDVQTFAQTSQTLAPRRASILFELLGEDARMSKCALLLHWSFPAGSISVDERKENETTSMGKAQRSCYP
jgi:hypothetical protein